MNRITSIMLAIFLATVASFAYAQHYAFINHDANVITLNGDDWTDLRRSITDISGKWQAVQIGDSHIQPGIVTACVRDTLQSHFGNGGRGLLAALNLVRTNEPRDYRLDLDCTVSTKVRLGGARPWAITPGVTGVAALPDSAVATISIRTKNSPHDNFNHITILHEHDKGYGSAIIGEEMFIGRTAGRYATTIDLPTLTDTVSMRVPTAGAFYGVIVENDNSGVIVSSIGNNGATYSMYCAIPDFAEQMEVFHPSLIIISLGTNEAFGNLNGVSADVDRLVTMLRTRFPKAHLLLTTPMECHRKVSTTVKKRVKNRRGRWRTVRRKSTTYAVNDKVAQMRDIILTYGKANKIAVWDLYTIAGAHGAASQWISAGLMNPNDHIHCKDEGYALQGSLLATALLKALQH